MGGGGIVRDKLIYYGSLLVLAGLAIWLGMQGGKWVDDAYITYRYSYNFATGNGLVYNVGEKYLGTSAPLFALTLGVLGMIFGPSSIPQWGTILSIGGLIFTLFAIYAMANDANRRASGFFAGIFLLITPITFISLGMETFIQIALILWGIVLYRRDKTVAATVCLAIAILVRPDALLALALIGGHYILKHRKVPVKEVGILAAILLPFLLASTIVYGAPMPGTMAAKMSQVKTGWWPDYIHGAKDLLLPFFLEIKYRWLYVALGVMGLPLLLRYRFWSLAVAWGIGYGLVYQVVGLPAYAWYFTPLVVAASIAMGCAVTLLWELRIGRYPAIAPFAAVGLCYLAFVQMKWLGAYVPQWARNVSKFYTSTGQWLAANTPADASVGYLEIGYIGYYSHRRIVDPLGLVNKDPLILASLREKDILSTYFRHKPDYILVNDKPNFTTLMGGITLRQWFVESYEQVAKLADPDDPNGNGIVVFRKKGLSL